MLVFIGGNKELQARVQELWAQTWMIPKYKFVHTTYYDSLSFENDSWLSEPYVIMKGDDIIGYIEVGFYRIPNIAEIKIAVNFTDDTMLMGKGLIEVVKLLISRRFHKIKRRGVEGNPILLQYEKLCKQYGGQIECVDRDGTRLWDGRYANVIHYGILESEYLQHIIP